MTSRRSPRARTRPPARSRTSRSTRRVFADLAIEDGGESVRWVLDGLEPSFTAAELAQRLQRLETHRDTRRDALRTASRMIERASRCYAVRFPAPSDLTERILHPARPMESNGLEDARFVRFVDDDGSVTYLAPYTAYDGSTISQQLLSTTDFEAFDSFPLLGAGAANKGLALFPRRVAGRYHALSRCDGERNALAVTDDLRHWPARHPARRHRRRVELGPARQLRFAHRARRGVARPHPRRRGDADVLHRRAPPRPRPPGHRHRPDRPSAPQPGDPTIRTATSRTSSTPAGRSATAIGCSSRSASPTAGSGSPPSPSPTCWRRCPITPPAVHSTRRSPVVAELTSVPVGLHEHSPRACRAPASIGAAVRVGLAVPGRRDRRRRNRAAPTTPPRLSILLSSATTMRPAGDAPSRSRPERQLRMRRFACEHCGSLVRFEASTCPVCCSRLGYLPVERTIRMLHPVGDDVSYLVDGIGDASSGAASTRRGAATGCSRPPRVRSGAARAG